VATHPLTVASGASQRAAAMDLATSASDTAVSTDYVNHGQEDGKQTSFATVLITSAKDVMVYQTFVYLFGCLSSANSRECY